MLAAMLAFLAVAVGLGSQFASAHDSLVESSPAANDEIEVAPASAVLTFSAEVQSEGTLSPQIELFAASAVEETAVALASAATVDGVVVTQALPELAAGNYTLNWQVVSSDGHPISGTIPFTVSVGVAPAEDAQPSATATAGFEGVQNTESSFTNNQSGSSEEAEQTTTSAPQDSGIPPWAWVLMGLAGVSVVLVAFVVFRRKAADLEASRKPRADGPEGDNAPTGV